MSDKGPIEGPEEPQNKSTYQLSEDRKATKWVKLREQLYRCSNFMKEQFSQFLSDKSFEGAYSAEESAEVNQELEQLVNMTRIPLCLERFMLWTLLACFDCFLHFLTAIPIRIINSILLNFSRRGRQSLSRTYNERFMAFMIMVASVILSKLDTSKAYHRIKRQSSVKLYMLFGVLEMADKMLASMGQSLFTVILSRSIFQRSFYRQGLLSLTTIIYLVCHGYVMVYQTVALNVAVNSYSNAFLTLLLSMQFAEIKSSLLKKIDKEGLFQLAIADVVERSQLIFLLIIISLRNVVAKSKSQSSVIPNSWNLHATSSVVLGVLCGPMFNVIGSELIVDWVKHAYVTKFNRIRPKIYDKFLLIICRDYKTSLHRFCDRLGLPIPALVVLFVVMMRPTLLQVLNISSPSSLAAAIFKCLFGFMCLILIKVGLRTLLMKWGSSILADAGINTAVTENEYVPGMLSGATGKIDIKARSILHYSSAGHDIKEERDSPILQLDTKSGNNIPPTLNEIRRRRDSRNPHSLENVARYKMVSKRIW